MTTEKVFENRKQEFENAYEEFNSFYGQLDSYFREKEISKEEKDVVDAIHKAVERLGEGKVHPKNPESKHFAYWDGDDLTRSEYYISQHLVSLSEHAANKVQKANVMGRWVKWRRHNEWDPVKTQLEKELEEAKKRVLVGDIESAVEKKLFAEYAIEALLSAHADRLLSLLDTTKSVLTALAHRIRLKSEEKQLNKTGQR